MSSIDARVKCDVSGIELNLHQIGDRVMKGITQALREEAENIRDLARDYAPVDEGNLEQAIRADRVDQEADSRGRARRAFWRVWIDLDRAAPSKQDPSKTVGDYFFEMHELLLPYGNGPYNLGPESRRKADGGKDVGGKFMERAFEDRIQHVYKRAFWEAQKALGKLRA